MMYMLLFIISIQRTNAGCPGGYYGVDCKTPCRFPNFGQKCQQQCNCTEDFCNPTNGCQTNQGCTDGFFGLKCAHQCRYPNFGKQCQSLCKCEPEHCNHISGCGFFTAIMYPGMRTKRTVITHSEESFLERNAFILIGISVFVVVMILAIFLFVVFKRRKSNTINNEEPDCVSEFSSFESEGNAFEQNTYSTHCQNNYPTVEMYGNCIV